MKCKKGKFLDHSNGKMIETLGVLPFLLVSAAVFSDYRYDVFWGDFNQLPSFSNRSPDIQGRSDQLDIQVSRREDYYAIVFRRSITVNRSGIYEFSLTSDDGSRLLVNNNEIINNDGLHGAIKKEGQLYLAAGNHQLQVEYFEKFGGNTLELFYRSQGGSFQPTPIGGDLVQTGPSKVGRWGNIIAWPEIAISAANLPDGRVLTWSSTETNAFPSNREYSHASVFDPVTESFIGVDNNFHDMFCAGISLLEDGRVLATGGNPSDRRSSSFDPDSFHWSPLAEMIDPRWYATNVTLPDNQVFTSFGKDAGNRSERYSADGDFWSPLNNVSMQTLVREQNAIQSAPNPSGAFTQEWFAHLAVTPRGQVFQGGPTQTWHLFNPSTNQPNQSLGQPMGDNVRMYGNAVTYDVGKVMLVGGGDRRQRSPTNENDVYLVDLNQAQPQVTRAAPMHFPRALSNSVTLPNGEVLVIGGNRSAKIFSDEGSVLPAELYSPSEDRWTVLASLSVPRNYHSTALLLKDGRVLSAGGGACGNGCGANHQDGQIFSPPYLFDGGGNLAQRPTLNDVPAVASAGQRLVVSASADTVAFSLVRLSGTTHHMNTDQRHIPLTFTHGNNGDYELALPENPNVLIVGNYWLFAMNAEGTPSVGATVQIVRERATQVDANPRSAFRTYRWTPTQLRAQNADSVQLAELSFYSQGQRVYADRVTNPSGNNPSGEGPNNVNDNRVQTKWLDFNKGALVYSFDRPVALERYSLATANDVPERDPVSWILEGRLDNGDWVLLDSQSQRSDLISRERFRTSELIGLNPSDILTLPSESEETDVSPVSENQDGVETAGTRVAEPDQASNGFSAVTPLPHSPRQSGTLLIESGSEQVWVANPDQNTVSAVINGQLRSEIAVGEKPWSLGLRPNSNQLFVINKADASLSIIDRARRRVMNTVQLPTDSQPHGLVFSRDGNHYFVVLEAAAVLEKRSSENHQVVDRLVLSGRPRHVSIAHDDSVVLVSNFITPPVPGENTVNLDIDAAAAEVFSVDPQSMTLNRTIALPYDNRSSSESQGPGLPNYLGAVAISFDNQWGYVPSKKDNIVAGGLRQIMGLTFDQTVRAGTSILDLGDGIDAPILPIDHDNASMATSSALSGDNRYLLTTLETSRELVIYDLTLGFQVTRLATGLAPQSVALSSNGRIAFVHNYMDRSVSRFDLTDILQTGLPQSAPVSTINLVSDERLASTVLKGKQLFYDAADDRLARDNYLSCASCHNDAMDDGRVWDFTHLGEGLRNTASLRGKGALMKKGLLHWSGNFDEVQDFEMNIRNLAGGTGLMADERLLERSRMEPLGTPKARVSDDLDALADFLGSLSETSDSPRLHQGDTLAQAMAGRALFVEKGCVNCHGVTALGTITVDELSDIGSITPESGQRLFQALQGLKPPSLANVWQTPPYLHNGAEATLAGAMDAHNAMALTPSDVNRLVAFLQCGASCELSTEAVPNEERATDYIPEAGDVITLSRSKGNYCADVSGVSRAAFASVHQWECIDTAQNQQWRLRQGDGGYLLVAEHSGLCMDVSWGSDQPEASVVQWYCHGGDNQLLNWANGSLVFKHSGLCLAANGNPLNRNGVDLVQMPCDQSAAQRFESKRLQ